ncbi:MAG: WD40 repeat domain-containing protein [Pirellula sp.]
MADRSMLCFRFNLPGIRSVCMVLIRLSICIVIVSSLTHAQESLPSSLGRVTAGRYDNQGQQLVLATEGALKLLVLKDVPGNENLPALDGQAREERFKSGRSILQDRSIELPFSQITKVEFSPDRKCLLIAGGDPGQRGCIQILSWPSGTSSNIIETYVDGKQLSDVVMDVKWFEDGSKWIETHWNAGACVRSRDGMILACFQGHTGPVTGGIPWNSELAITCGIDQTIKLWKISNGELVRSLDNHTSAVLGVLRWNTPTGKPLLISLGRDRTLRLWDPAIGRLIRFVRLPALPLKMEFSDSGGLVVLLENQTVSLVSLPDLIIQKTIALEIPSVTTLVRIDHGRWLYW